ncbi:MAG: hypothetical protein KTR21_06600 [Rhodobacteraceae bacterium]|nr:hypothetical protein [Paracoccaceae bacterium]
MPQHPPPPQNHLSHRLDLLEQLVEERWRRLDATLTRLEAGVDRLDRRLWLAAATCAAAGASLIGASLLNLT